MSYAGKGTARRQVRNFHLPPVSSAVLATLVRVRAECQHYRGTSHAAVITTTPSTRTPARESARTDSAAVAPVVRTSSTNSTHSGRPVSRSGGTDTRPARFSTRLRADSPTESLTPAANFRTGSTRTGSGANACEAASATASTESPPRDRAARARLGAGTRTRPASSGGSISPSSRNARTAAATATPKGTARSRLPRSFAATTADRSGPSWAPRAHTRTPGSTRGVTGTGRPDNTPAHRRHHRAPCAPHPPHSRGRTRSNSARMGAVCTPIPTPRPQAISRAAPESP